MMQQKDGKTLLEAQLEYEFSLLQGDLLKDSIREEVSALLEWFEKIELNDLVSNTDVSDWVKRNVIDIPIPDELIALVTESSQKVHAFLQKSEFQIETILAKEQYDQFVENIIDLEELRHELTSQSVNSSIYAQLISHVLYNGIKDFIVSDNIFTKKIPGAASLLKIGKGVMNMTAPKLEENIDIRLTGFIKKNIQSSIRGSEKFLNSALDATFLKQIGNEIWDTVAKEKVSLATDYIDSNNINSFSHVIHEHWAVFRKTPFFNDICNEVINHFFENYGHKTIKTILEEMKISKDMVIKEAIEILVPFFEKSIVIQYLKKRIRTRLESFYASDYFSKKNRSLII